MEVIVSDDRLSVGFEDRIDSTFDATYLRKLAGNEWKLVGMLSEKSLSRSPNQTKSENLLKHVMAKDQHGNVYYDCADVDPVLYETPGYNSVLFFKKESNPGLPDFEAIGEGFLGEDQFKEGHYDKCFSIVEAIASSYHDGGAIFLSVPPGKIDSFIQKMKENSREMGGTQIDIQDLGPKKKRRQ